MLNLLHLIMDIDRSVKRYEKIGLGHARLAVIDLSDSAAQPMWIDSSSPPGRP
jgi:asparagine synthetase B (glutamine-hydrolysing)